ncbi:ABC transporter ATP-binding protein [Pseudodesulfovibrio sp. zrk46]|uniref:ABC transporter ATP-binding protein n=1 Tax=Pseudodesulfovibrio sp. zrk46 TaxID=2725288 RepID=UPI001449D251|nr:ABC transporter ATP-binding protein [Pseudodesulfovibrio sp. zrk46]QJB58214.1 ABC transporter ATP-binding protein [Pseudodesulfovibrio sp. zrk46]
MTSVTYTLDNLSFDYGGTEVLRNLNHVFEPGLVHAVVGPNGSGKSTLLSLLAGHHSPVFGQALVNDSNVTALSPKQQATLCAMVPQEFRFNFPFSVFDAVLMGRHPHIPRFSRPSDEDITAAHAAMITMDIAHLSARPLSELSGGEKQRTVFARALAQSTPGLLLDEPTSSMDIRHALAAMTELRRLARKDNRTIIAVLHDLNLAASYCDRVLIFKDGRIHAHGTPGNALTPETIRDVFGVTAQVMRDSSNSLVITYVP